MEAPVANPEHFVILKQGIDVWNKWRRENYEIRIDLRGTNLAGANLVEFDLSRVNLQESNLTRANLTDSSLRGSIMTDCNLKGANLSRTDLSDTDLTGANLSKSIMIVTILLEANINETDFREATIGWCSFGNIDLSNTRGLNTTNHTGPSYIDFHTIYRSRNNIPKKFLRGAGIPESFIEYMPSFTGQPFDYYSCFISFSSKDQEFADRIYADLQNKSVRCWFAPEDMKGGKKIHRQLDEAIRYHDKLLLVLSENSLKSDWVANEIKWARKREKESGKQKLFPISLVPYKELDDWDLFDSDTATDLASEVRSYHIPDFTQWQSHTEYKKAFDQLMRDLKAED
jgi:uncharacterized protein YjbI with pentapeptide repeats